MYPQYEFKKIEIDKQLNNEQELLNYLFENYLHIDNFIDYNIYEITNIHKFKWHWAYDSIKFIKKITNKIPKFVYIGYHHSQHNEDYIIQQIFKIIGTINKTLVDIGSKDGKYISNIYSLIKQEWKCLLVDPIANEKDSNDKIKFLKKFAKPDNINEMLKNNNIPKNLDFFNIDIDGNDIHILKAILDYNPRLICIEANARNDRYKKNIYHDYNDSNGVEKQASILAILSEVKDKYTLIYNNGGNVFFSL